MRIFTDVLTGSEVLSDAMEMTDAYDGCVHVVPSKLVDPGNVDDVDIGCGNEFGGAEENYGGEPVVKVNNVLHLFNLQVEPYSEKKEFQDDFKQIINKVKKDKIVGDDQITKNWSANGSIVKLIKDVLADFDNWEFYTPEVSDDFEGEKMIIFAKWHKDDDPGQHFYYIKDLMKETKV